ncbi:hypothetical protein [Sphingomonas sp. LY160]|uniref:hypothetical protein n=1 Tax=Sphingomonas sp. LY160 TaxID=3095342 RepID=UPI003A10214C
MGEPKAFASLSSGLLARKGAARPAMRPQGFGQVGAGLEDLGWNDMGFEAPKPVLAPVLDQDHDAFGNEVGEQPLRNPLSALTPIASPVHDQQAEIAERFAAHDEDGEDEDGEYIDETAELYDPKVEDDRSHVVLTSKSSVNAPSFEDEADVEETLELEEVAEPVSLAPFAKAQVVLPPDVPVAFEPVKVAPARSRRTRSAPGSKPKAAFTLRLDPDRHLKLRLACAVTGQSAQQLVTEALDRLLADMPELDGMASKAQRTAR